MQSINGDVQLSVTLDTKGITSDAQKIKREIEKEFSKSSNAPTFGGVDSKEIKKSVEEMDDYTESVKSAQEAESDLHKSEEERIRALVKQVRERNNTESSVERVETEESVVEALDEERVTLEDLKKSYSDIINKQDQFKQLTTDENVIQLSDKTAEQQLQAVQSRVAELSDEEQDMFDAWVDSFMKARKAQQQVIDNQRSMSEEQKEIVVDTQRYQTAIADAKSQLQLLAYDYETMSKGYHYSDDFVRLKTDAEYLTKELNKTNEKLRQMELSGEQDTEEYQKMAEKANNLSRVLNDVVADMSIMRDDGSAFEAGIDVDQLETSKKLFDTMCNKVALMQQRMKELSGETDNLSKNTSKVSFSSKLHDSVVKFKNVLKDFGTNIKTGLGMAVQSIGKNFTKLSSNVRKIGSGFKTLSRHLSASNKHLGIGLKQVLGYVIGIRSLFALFGKLKGMITEGTKNLIMWHNGSNRANEAVSTLTSSLTYLKNSWGAAFEPLLSYITPILDTFIQKLADVANAISYMLAKLTGQSTWYKAIRVQKDYAKSLDKTGNAASNAEKKLASYDKLEVIQKDKGGGSGVDGMFEEMPIETVSETVDDILDKFKKSWEDADFTDVGNVIGLKLKDALDSIPWDYIQEFARKLAHSIATLLNGFFETEGLGASIGRTIAEAFNTVFHFVDEFVHTLHWDSIGKFIGEGLFSFVDTFDAETAGRAVGGTIRGIIETLYTSLDTFAEQGGFELIGEKIATFILTGLEEMSNVRESGLTGWQELGESITIAVDSLLTSITTAIKKISEGEGWYDLGKGIAELCSKIDFTKFVDDLNALAESIVKAIGEALKGIGDTSPISTAIAAIIAGLLITVDTITLVIMAATVVFGFDLGKQIGDMITGGEDSMWYQTFSWSDLFKENEFNDVVGGMLLMLDAWAEGVTKPQNAFQLLGSILLGPLTIMLECYRVLRMIGSGEIWDNIKKRSDETFYWWKIILTDTWNGILKFVDGAKSKFNELVTTVWDKITMFGNDLEFWWNDIIEGFKSFFVDCLYWWNDFFTNVQEYSDNFGEDFNTLVNDLISAVESLINAIAKGLNSLLSSIGSIDIDVPDWIPEIGGKSWNFSFPKIPEVSLPRLAQGAVIPPNKEFLAVLGDQKSGTNIETPLATMMDAFRQVLNENGGSGNNNQPIVLQLNGRVLAQAVWDEERKKYRQTSSYSY